MYCTMYIPFMLFRPIKYDHTDKFWQFVALVVKSIKNTNSAQFSQAKVTNKPRKKLATKEKQTSCIKLIAALDSTRFNGCSQRSTSAYKTLSNQLRENNMAICVCARVKSFHIDSQCMWLNGKVLYGKSIFFVKMFYKHRDNFSFRLFAPIVENFFRFLVHCANPHIPWTPVFCYSLSNGYSYIIQLEEKKSEDRTFGD